MKRTLLPTHAFINKALLLNFFILPIMLLCINTAFAQSDDCNNPPALTVNAAAVSGTTSGATQTIPAITCYYTGSADDDVFYSFTTSVAGNYVITVIGSGNFDAVMDLCLVLK